ncbi:BLUF domain-containing protein [Rasiella rasia]|uniref:BLUF domain-containing protein n=1 Tax=Rasiella rasia TaxID=2744027 RepID=A0A6G6GPE1_9FLAO|nr:BLUF domain-containing protein [Rasiella rasia]QIE60407.1 BLUF domain-containing protein [Rasiella rasia]
MIYTLCYVSKAAENLDASSLEEIFSITINKNTKRGISGILMYGMGNFFQVLEGEEQTVETLYKEQILKDPRHSDIFEVIRKPTEIPIFKEYSSLFTIVKTNEQLAQIKKYLNQHRVDSSTSEKLGRLLKPFLLEI